MNGNAYNPTPIQFYYTFKKLFSVNFCTPIRGNCEQDNDEILSSVITNFARQNKIYIEDEINEGESVHLNDDDYRKMDINEQDAFRYICGYLIRKCLKKYSCNLCLNYTKEYTDLNETSFYCFFRAHNSNEENLFGSLYMPITLLRI
jgi:hypothetical protein